MGEAWRIVRWPFAVDRWPWKRFVIGQRQARSAVRPTANSQQPTANSQRMTNLLVDGPSNAPHTLVLAHGAGGGMETPFLNVVARAIGARGIRVVRFEFPYMAARRTGQKRGAPDRQPVLLQAWRDVVEELGGGAALVIGGKSLGGRMATMVADELRVRGVVCLGYPFHPPGQPERLRTAHLETLATPTLIVQGTRDPFGTREEVARYRISPNIRIEWLEGGDHSFKPRKETGYTEREHLGHAAGLTAEFMSSLT
jgi:predicted alpha/beta-hydrolase family hydrolase